MEETQPKDNEHINPEQENALTKIFKRNPDEIDEDVVEELLEYSAELQEMDLEFIETAMDLIGNFDVTWDRPWYQMADFLQRSGEFKIIDNTNREDKFMTNNFSADEIKLIHKNWKKFVKEYDIPDQPTSLFRCKIGESRKQTTYQEVRYFIVAYLSRGLKRTLFQVYKRCVTEYLHTDKGPYTPVEEKIVTLFLKHCTSVRSPVQELARILGRPPRQIYTKLEELRFGKKTPVQPKKWDLSRATKLVKYLMKYTELPLEQLNNKEIEHSVWLQIEAKMKNYEKNLIRFWYSRLHVQLFVKEDLKYRTTLKKLFTILKGSSYKKWSDIQWKEIVKHFPEGVTWWFLYYNGISPFKSTWAHKFMTVPEIAQYFLDERLHAVRKRRLKRLVLNADNKLQYLENPS